MVPRQAVGWGGCEICFFVIPLSSILWGLGGLLREGLGLGIWVGIYAHSISSSGLLKLKPFVGLQAITLQFHGSFAKVDVLTCRAGSFFGGNRAGALNPQQPFLLEVRAPKPYTQRLQSPLINEYTLNYGNVGT